MPCHLLYKPCFHFSECPKEELYFGGGRISAPAPDLLQDDEVPEADPQSPGREGDQEAFADSDARNPIGFDWQRSGNNLLKGFFCC